MKLVHPGKASYCELVVSREGKKKLSTNSKYHNKTMVRIICVLLKASLHIVFFSRLCPVERRKLVNLQGFDCLAFDSSCFYHLQRTKQISAGAHPKEEDPYHAEKNMMRLIMKRCEIVQNSEWKTGIDPSFNYKHITNSMQYCTFVSLSSPTCFSNSRRSCAAISVISCNVCPLKYTVHPLVCSLDWEGPVLECFPV